MVQTINKKSEVIRYGIVGGLNTALDVILMLFFVFIGIEKITANYMSTSVAFLFSFTANRSFTFRSTSASISKQFGLFLIVTLTGLWVIQPIIITAIYNFLINSAISEHTSLVFAKLAATIVTVIWNYVFYSKVVFTIKTKGKK